MACRVMTRSLDLCREEWRDLVEVEYRRAEEACNGVLLNRSREFEFRSKFGIDGYALRRILFRSSTTISHRYASEELIRHWATHPHVTFEEFAWGAGFRHKFLRQARVRGRAASRLFAA